MWELNAPVEAMVMATHKIAPIVKLEIILSYPIVVGLYCVGNNVMMFLLYLMDSACIRHVCLVRHQA
jgi:hypothetical protein